MAVFKCKMCGGALEITEGVTVAECEYCGIQQTVPTADNEKKMNLFARANRLRAACEFDKAASIYESIVAEFPEEPEAYWGLVLCEYGIEYVDDPATGKKIPTCHRSAFESVMKNSNVELAQEYADITAKRIYREEAKQIEELRRNIISVSENEEPYDIFICYKETDFDGKRTLDSVLAQDIYDALTTKNYRVFFSRISLEDKLGVEYEPYIFAALNSAKIMLVIGTDYEFLNAVWVKNEWSRFLKLMAKDKQKHLVPCYKGIDAYDMPEEFARLQAQDLDKMGAIQDILRGVEKLLPKERKPVAEATAAQSYFVANPTVDSYLKRVSIFLADGDFKSADEYCEKVLDIDPENAQAYLGKLLAELRVPNVQSVKELVEPFDKSNNYLKVKQFGDENTVSTLEGYLTGIKDDIEKNIKRMMIQQTLRRFISAGHNHTVCMRADGTVIATGENVFGQCNTGNWTYITAVSAGYNHTVGLKTDGTVVAIGSNYYGQCNVLLWSDIVDISTGYGYTIGLRSNGTVVAAGCNENGEGNVQNWQNIVAVAAGGNHTVGLMADGTVVATGDNDEGQCDVSGWRDIIAIAAGAYHTIGIKTDGTVVATGYNRNNRCSVGGWKDIISASGGEFHTVAVKGDGTVVTAGKTDNGQCDLVGMTDIVAVAAGGFHTLGVRRNGTVIAIGDNSLGQCNVNGIRLFMDVSTIERERASQMQAAHIGKQNLRNAGLCQYCGGEFRGLVTKKCVNCGREKDY